MATELESVLVRAATKGRQAGSERSTMPDTRPSPSVALRRAWSGRASSVLLQTSDLP
jgi:hypothetical protein